ncbi:MAG: archease [Syntrophaceae bacterium]|nr:archease [Syntrophaceae bacterium]
MKRYETFDHTADIGVRVFGRTVEEVFVNAAYALFDQLTDLTQVGDGAVQEISVEGSDQEDLLIRWLGELLFLCQSRGYLFKNFSILSLDSNSLKALARGEIFDPSRHRFKTEIKGVTYHQVEVRQKDRGWEGRVVFDV